MDRTERFYKIDRLIHERRLVPFTELQVELDVSRATLKRDLEYMRNRLNAPTSGIARPADTALKPPVRGWAVNMNCPAYGSPRRKSMPC